MQRPENRWQFSGPDFRGVEIDKYPGKRGSERTERSEQRAVDIPVTHAVMKEAWTGADVPSIAECSSRSETIV